MLVRGIAAALLCAAGLLGAPVLVAAAAPVADSPHGGPMPPLPPQPPPPAPAQATPPASIELPAPPAPPPSVPVALALAGAAALAGLTGTGSWIGYRQAKAGFALRAAGTARFLP